MIIMLIIKLGSYLVPEAYVADNLMLSKVFVKKDAHLRALQPV